MTDYAVIMAGGSGTRFWPLSRRSTPKQLLALGPTDDSLLRATVDRLAGLIPPDRVLVVTAAHLADQTAAQLPEVPRENILAEPVGRNTAPCVGWAAAHIARRAPDARVMVLPADHYIVDADAYRATLMASLEATELAGFVTIGIQPSRPETGYGYIEVADELQTQVFAAKRFVEKPDAARAQEYLDSGRFLWNSGMFFFRVGRVLEAIDAHLPALGAALKRFDEAAATGQEAEVVKGEYGGLPAISFDHGVMEKADSVAVVPAMFDWSDLGSWTSAWELSKKDAQGNATPLGSVCIDAEGCLARTSGEKLVALVGVRDLIVIETDDAILVMPRCRDQDVRRIVETLKEREDPRH